MLVILIWVFPVIAACLAFVCYDLARSMRQKASGTWTIFAFFLVVLLVLIVLWVIYRGDLNAGRWSKEWFS